MRLSLYRLFWLSYAIHQWLTRHFTTSGLVVLGCLLLTAAMGGDTNHSLTYQIFTFLLALLLLAIVVSLPFRYRFSATRILPRFGTVGMPLKYRVVLQPQNRKPQRGLHLVEDFADPRPSFQAWRETPEPFEHKRLAFDRMLGYYRWLWLLGRNQRATVKPVALPLLLLSRSTDVMVELIPLHRGMIRFKGLTLTHADPLGLFNACRPIALPQSLLILPKLYQLPPISLPGLRRYQSGGVALASSVGDSEEFRSLREYRPGDSPRKIHWKSWAKTGKPIVKEEQDEFFVRHALILDTFQSEPQSERLEAAVSVAASFACEVQTQESLLDLMFVGLEAYCFTFGRGLSHTDKMLEILASVGACRDRSFNDLIPVVMQRIALLSGCICIFLTWDDTRQALVRQLQGMRLPLLVLVLAEEPDTPELRAATLINNTLTTLRVLKLSQLQEELLRL
jgi:uncharacterized protein (DUF58 family)